jgi:fibrillarin-like rRNA methylase
MRGKDDALLTKNTVPGESVYNEKRVSVEVSIISIKDMNILFNQVPQLLHNDTSYLNVGKSL